MVHSDSGPRRSVQISGEKMIGVDVRRRNEKSTGERRK